MSLASSALVGKLSGADAGMEKGAGPLAVVNAGSAQAKAAAQTATPRGTRVLQGVGKRSGSVSRPLRVFSSRGVDPARSRSSVGCRKLIEDREDP